MAKERFAAVHGKTTLYKFRPFTNEGHVERVRQIVQDHKIYFARRSQLNDPFDLAPIIRLGGNYDDPSLRLRLIENAKAVFIRNDPDLTASQIDERCARLMTCDLVDFERWGQQTVLQRLENDYWVFSLAGNREHPMLWSHYADGHSGLCLHFRSDEQSVFGASQRVEYRSSRPTIDFPFVTSEHEIASLATLTKGEFWTYEEEFRFIRYPNIPFSDVGLQLDGQLATYPPHLLAGISVGPRMPPHRVAQVVAMAEAHEASLPVWRACETRTFSYEFDRIA